MNDNEKRKIEHDCANAPISTAHKLGERGQTLEDLWIYEQEKEKVKAARAESHSCSKKCDRHEGKCDNHDGKCCN